MITNLPIPPRQNGGNNGGTKAETPLEEVTAPRTFHHTRRVGGRLSLAGVGDENADIMFIATCPQEEEVQEVVQTCLGKEFRLPAAYLKGPGGALLTDICLRHGIDLKVKAYYTSMIKWLPDKAKRSRPDKAEIAFWRESLVDEIRRVKPKIIVCLGGPVFDELYPLKFRKGDLRGGFFRSDAFNCVLYPCEDLYKLVKKPEYYGRFYIDMQEVARMNDMMLGKIEPVELYYETIHNAAELRGLVAKWHRERPKLMSVDCEWAGRNHVDGQLRSIQFAWQAGHAAYIRFMDDQMNYVFDISYAEAGEILEGYLGDRSVQYVGHHLPADLPWMAHVLGLSVYERTYLDTEFALQCCDEFAELSLERLAIAFTDLGRYDVDLMIWKKTSKQYREEEGYGRIPDSLLIPYALRDVDTVIRAVPAIVQWLRREGVDRYYFELFHPFVSDVFTEFALQGLPMDIERMDELRLLFHGTRRIMERQLQVDISKEARRLLWQRMYTHDPEHAEAAFYAVENALLGDNDAEAGFMALKAFAGINDLLSWQHLFDHYTRSPEFNIRSVEQMRAWLFDVKGYTPIKSTKKEELGLPSMDWSKIMEYDAAKRAQFDPSVDRQTLEILAATHRDELLNRLLELNAVGNLCKAFLKEAELDPETGEAVKENGLHFWLASDGRVHGQMSTTETGRPRAWKPNCLNWPGDTREQIVMGIQRALQRAKDEGALQPGDPLLRYLDGEAIPAIRSCVKAPPGWMMVESDYATAELRALAFISGDEAFIRLMTEPDYDFALARIEGIKDPVPIRLRYSEGPIAHEHRDPAFIMAFAEKGEVKRRLTEADLMRNADGSLVHPMADLHWTLAEEVQKRPREAMNKKLQRVAAKRGNFGATYGIMGGTLERQIEQETGQKPEPGTGDAVLEALETSRPVAFKMLKDLEDTPVRPGWLRAASGRKRRFALHPFSLGGISSRDRKSMISSQGREARNFFFQQIVADTAARAAVWLLREYRSRGMRAYPMIVLYDSIVTLCPVEERHVCEELHQRYMTDLNCWSHHGRVWNFLIDTDHNKRWSSKATKEEAAEWENI